MLQTGYLDDTNLGYFFSEKLTPEEFFRTNTSAEHFHGYFPVKH